MQRYITEGSPRVAVRKRIKRRCGDVNAVVGVRENDYFDISRDEGTESLERQESPATDAGKC